MIDKRFKYIKSNYVFKKLIKKYNKKAYNALNIISKNYFLSEDIIIKYQDKLNWYYVTMNIIKYGHASEDFIEKCKDKLDWQQLSKIYCYSDYIIDKFIDNFDLNEMMIVTDSLPERLLDKYFYKLHLEDYNYLFANYKLSEEFIEKHINEYKNNEVWNYISSYQKLSEEFIERHKCYIRFGRISKYQSLSENFIEKYKYVLNWSRISRYQKLSESFIHKYENYVNWYGINECQQLSEEFIKQHIDKIQESILNNKNCKLSPKFKASLEVLFCMKGA